jgi:hypothetical protein
MTDNSRLAALGHRARVLHELLKQPGWTELERLANERKDSFEKKALNAMWRGEPLTAAAVAGEVAFQEAVRFILKQPSEAEHRFEHQAKKGQ